jgi:hypothetical protein
MNKSSHDGFRLPNQLQQRFARSGQALAPSPVAIVLEVPNGVPRAPELNMKPHNLFVRSIRVGRNLSRSKRVFQGLVGQRLLL